MVKNTLLICFVCIYWLVLLEPEKKRVFFSYIFLYTHNCSEIDYICTQSMKSQHWYSQNLSINTNFLNLTHKKINKFSSGFSHFALSSVNRVSQLSRRNVCTRGRRWRRAPIIGAAVKNDIHVLDGILTLGPNICLLLYTKSIGLTLAMNFAGNTFRYFLWIALRDIQTGKWRLCVKR